MLQDEKTFGQKLKEAWKNIDEYEKNGKRDVWEINGSKKKEKKD